LVKAASVITFITDKWLSCLEIKGATRILLRGEVWKWKNFVTSFWWRV